LGNASWNEARSIAGNYRGGGYSDWHLPTQSELNSIYRNLRARNIGGLGDNWYWSSTGYDNSNAWDQHFSDGRRYSANKNYPLAVRAVRAF
jgi:hypothetical protein